MRSSILAVALLFLHALTGCEGSFGFQEVREGEGPRGGGPVLLGQARDGGGRPDASGPGASDAGVTQTPDASVTPDAYTARDAYAPPSCMPMCTGRTCGSDGCGGTCGSCATGSTCNGSGMCAPNGPPVGEVVLYGTTSCGYCRSARAYFTARGVPFRDVSLSAPGAFEEAVTTAESYGRAGWGGGGMPFIKWPGERVPGNFTNGFSESLAAAHGL